MMLLFQMEAQNDYSPELKSRFFSEMLKDKKQSDYLERLYGFTRENLREVDALIGSESENWRIGRIGKVDFAVIRTAILEIMYMEDIPDSVAINEAVNIAKKYGTNDSGRFVNGILGRVVRIKNGN